MLLLEDKNKMLHLRLKAYLQAFMFGEQKVHEDVTILCSSSLPSSDISIYRYGFCFCLHLSMLLNFWIWSCMINGVISRPSLQCCHHHLLFLVLIISLLSFFHGFPICPEQNIYQNIALFKSLWNYLSNLWSFIKKRVQTRELCPFYFSAACCPKLILGRVALSDSGITSCRNLRLFWFLICWNHNFMVLLNIQKYSVFSLRDHAEFWWDRWLLANWPGDVNDLDNSIF
jgi:hypothetical protein